MSQQPGHRSLIDGFEFAAAGAKQQGALPLSSFPRLGDLLVSDAGQAAYAVEGVRDAWGRPSLEVKVQATLQVRCQRCLEPMALEVDTESLLVLAATQAEIEADVVGPDAPDRVVAGKDMPLADLVEDELILALPYAPRHESCTAAQGTQVEKRVETKSSPFAGLKDLLGDKH